MEKRKKTSHHRFLWRCFWKATKKKSSTENTFEKVFASEKIIMKGKKMLFISKTHQQRKFYESLLTPLWFSQLSAFPSRCSPAVVYWWMHFSLFFSFYDSFRIFSLFISILLIFFAPNNDFSHLREAQLCFVAGSQLTSRYSAIRAPIGCRCANVSAVEGVA